MTVGRRVTDDDKPRTYETYECPHKKNIRDDNGILCPRYCGAGHAVIRTAPRRYERTWIAADESAATAGTSYDFNKIISHDESGIVSNGVLNNAVVNDEEASNAHVRPEVYARPAVPGEIPPSAIRLELLARTRGFVTAVTYARGTRGRTVRDSILVRGRHADGRAFGAHWLDGVADASARKVRHLDGQVTDLSAKDLTAWLTQTGSDDTC